jgi:hypothetical protein
LDIKVKKFICDFLNQYLKSAWKQVLLFSIPKPKEWDANLDNVRSIVLLETLCKVFVKVITQHLNKILSSNKILQYNNQAGLIEQSIFQLLQIIQHVIEHANLNNLPFGWVFKTYQKHMIMLIDPYYV